RLRVEVDEQQIEIAIVVEVHGGTADAVGLMAYAPSLAYLAPGLAVGSSPERIAALARRPAIAALSIHRHIDVRPAIVVEVFDDDIMSQRLESENRLG